MRIYEIIGKQAVTHRVVADSHQKAVEIFRAQHPGFRVEEVSWEDEYRAVIGYCEVSSKPIFEDDDFGCDDEGVMILREHFPPDWGTTKAQPA